MWPSPRNPTVVLIAVPPGRVWLVVSAGARGRQAEFEVAEWRRRTRRPAPSVDLLDGGGRPLRVAVLVDDLRPDALDEVGRAQAGDGHPELLVEHLLEAAGLPGAAQRSQGDRARGRRLRAHLLGRLLRLRHPTGPQPGDDLGDMSAEYAASIQPCCASSSDAGAGSVNCASALLNRRGRRARRGTCSMLLRRDEVVGEAAARWRRRR